MNNIQASKIPPSTTTIVAKCDSSESNHYFPLRDIESLQDFVAEHFGPIVVLPNTYKLTENSPGKLTLSSSFIYPSNKTAVFGNLQHSLISLC